MNEPTLGNSICMPGDILQRVYQKQTNEQHPQIVQLSEDGKIQIYSLVELLTTQTESFQILGNLIEEAIASGQVSSNGFEFIAKNALGGFQNMCFDKLIVDIYNQRILFIYKSMEAEIPYRISIAFSNGIGEDNGTFYKVALNLYKKTLTVINGKQKIVNHNIAAVNLYIGRGGKLELGIFKKDRDFKAIHSINKKKDERISDIGKSFERKMQPFFQMTSD